ncbi:hypothetical protein ABMA46_07585 [Mesorhizobium sp. CN5-321]|uniref:hypothetical protein n=1 Tax=Mesorhizobium hunchu TaxID=3157708 RepID=UPI0032B78AB6
MDPRVAPSLRLGLPEDDEGWGLRQKISPHLSCLFHTWSAEREAGMEEWGTDGDYDVLGRIVALLFSLATVADIAVGLPGPRRRYLLGILSVAEAAAHDFLIGPGTPVSAGGQDTADDALRLAARLRALAMLLMALLMQAVTLPNATHPFVVRKTPALHAGRPASSAAPDTS